MSLHGSLQSRQFQLQYRKGPTWLQLRSGLADNRSFILHVTIKEIKNTYVLAFNEAKERTSFYMSSWCTLNANIFLPSSPGSVFLSVSVYEHVHPCMCRQVCMCVCARALLCMCWGVVHMPVWAYTFIPEVNLCVITNVFALVFLTMEIWLEYQSILLSPSLPPPMRLQTCAKVFHGGDLNSGSHASVQGVFIT